MEISSHCSSSRLVDDAEDFEAGNPRSILGSLFLCCIEVSRYRDDCFLDFLSDFISGNLLEIPKDQCGDLLNALIFHSGHFDLAAVLVIADNIELPLLHTCLHFLVLEAFADHSFRVENKSRLVSGAIADKDLASLVEADPRGSGVPTQAVREDLDRLRLRVPDAHA